MFDKTGFPFEKLWVCASLVALCFMTPNAFAVPFGYSGYDGQSGRNGEQGHNGDSEILFADGSSLSLDLSGSDGRDGHEGEYGRHATGCGNQGYPAYNLEGASGGNGGSGGSGGRGGDGGNVTAYFSDLSQLQQIRLDSTPGRGGYGGYGARGGAGCRCHTSSWQVEVNGEAQTFFCTSGRNGSEGYHGNNGAVGRYGSIRLIGQLEPLIADVIHLHVNLTDAIGQNFLFGRNRWELKSGARELFARGSRIANSYQNFVERAEQTYGFIWDAERQMTDFSSVGLTLTMTDQFKVEWDHDSGFFHTGEETINTDGSIDYVFTKAATLAEARNLEIDEISGSGSDLSATIKDNSGHTFDFDHQIYINYSTKALLLYYSRYRGTVAADYIQIAEGKITIAIGRLPIDSHFLQAGMRTRIYFSITRKMGNHSTEKELQTFRQL